MKLSYREGVAVLYESKLYKIEKLFVALVRSKEGGGEERVGCSVLRSCFFCFLFRHYSWFTQTNPMNLLIEFIKSEKRYKETLISAPVPHVSILILPTVGVVVQNLNYIFN